MRLLALPGVLAALVLALSAYLPAVASAQTSDQFDPLAFGTSLFIGLTPHYPAPGDSVHLTAEGNGLDLAGSVIVWRAGGKVIAQGGGATSADITAGGLGSETPVELDVANSDGTVRSAQATIAPTELDLLMSSDSYVPPFYRGRALPSAGTNLVLQALARFKRADGTLIPDSAITYTWKRNGEVLGNISGRGKSSAIIPVAHLFTSDAITVDAVSSDGTRSGEATVSAPSGEPVLDLYEDHPLYGILYNNAIGANTSIPESEMAFAAIPYFAQAKTPNDAALSYAWRVNDTRVSASASTPSELTINADNSTGQANVALEVTHATNFYMDATGQWSMIFSRGAASQDSFHTSTQ